LNKETSYGVNFKTQDLRGEESSSKLENVEINLSTLYDNNIHFVMLLFYDFESKEIHDVELSLLINNKLYDDSKPDTKLNGFLYGVIYYEQDQWWFYEMNYEIDDFYFDELRVMYLYQP